MGFHATTAVNILIFEEYCPVRYDAMKWRFADVSVELTASIFRKEK
jgi:hypothetical protein